MAKQIIDLGEVSAGLICPQCDGSDFEREGDGNAAVVRCKECGHEVGTVSEIRKVQTQTVAKRTMADLKKAIRKGFKKR